MKYKVTLNGKVFEVEVERGEAILTDEYEAAAIVASPPAASPAPAPMPIAAPAPASAMPASGDAVSSPLPGSVMAIHVREGERVKDKQVLLVIEAMKMENEVLAPRAGTITQIVVKQGESVETGTPLLFMD